MKMETTWTWWTITQLTLFFLMMIGFGCSLQLNRFGKHMKQPKGIIIGFLSQFVIMPFLCWFLTEHGNLEDHLNVALILIGCCPGGAGSNMLCYIFQMDIELSVAMTTCSSIAAIGLMPLNCYIYLEWMKNISFEFDWIGLIVSCLVVVFGTLFGMLINLKFYHHACKLEKLGIISMVGIGLGTFINNSMSDVQLWNYKPSHIYLLAAAPFVLGFIIGFIISFATKLNKASCIAVATETGLQNSVLAVAVITLTFKDEELREEATGLPILYGVFSMAFGALFSFIFFHLGWSNAGKGLGVIKAFKQYKAERREMVVKNQKQSHTTDNKNKNKNKNNNKAGKQERKRVQSISMKEREAYNFGDQSTATSSSTSTSQLKSGNFKSKMVLGSNSNTPNNSARKIHIDSDYDTEHEQDSDGSPIKRARDRVTKDNSDNDDATPAQETELQVLTVAAKDESQPLPENQKIKEHDSAESIPLRDEMDVA